MNDNNFEDDQEIPLEDYMVQSRNQQLNHKFLEQIKQENTKSMPLHQSDQYETYPYNDTDNYQYGAEPVFASTNAFTGRQDPSSHHTLFNPFETSINQRPGSIFDQIQKLPSYRPPSQRENYHFEEEQAAWHQQIEPRAASNDEIQPFQPVMQEDDQIQKMLDEQDYILQTQKQFIQDHRLLVPGNPLIQQANFENPQNPLFMQEQGSGQRQISPISNYSQAATVQNHQPLINALTNHNQNFVGKQTQPVVQKSNAISSQKQPFIEQRHSSSPLIFEKQDKKVKKKTFAKYHKLNLDGPDSSITKTDLKMKMVVKKTTPLLTSGVGTSNAEILSAGTLNDRVTTLLRPPNQKSQKTFSKYVPLNLGCGALNIKKVIQVEKEKQQEEIGAPVAAVDVKVERDAVKEDVCDDVAQVEPEQRVENVKRLKKEEIRDEAKNCAPPEKEEVQIVPPRPKEALTAQLQVVNLEVESRMEVPRAPIVVAEPEPAEVLEEEELLPPPPNIDYVSILLRDHQQQLEDERRREHLAIPDTNPNLLNVSNNTAVEQAGISQLEQISFNLTKIQLELNQKLENEPKCREQEAQTIASEEMNQNQSMMSRREQLTQQSFNQIEIQQSSIAVERRPVSKQVISNEMKNAVAFDYNQIIEEALQSAELEEYENYVETVRQEIVQVIGREEADEAGVREEEEVKMSDAKAESQMLKAEAEVKPMPADTKQQEIDLAPHVPSILLHLVGSTNPKAFRVEPISSNLNEDDVFVLEAQHKLYFWHGEDCSEDKKNVSLELCERISKCQTREVPAQIVFPKQDEEAAEEFWKLLGGKPNEISKCFDLNLGELADARFSYFKISDASGSMKTTEIKDRPLYKSHLDTKDIFLLEEDLQIYVWIGANSNTAERRNAARIGQQFILKFNKPKGTIITHLDEGEENECFKSFFHWHDEMTVDQPTVGVQDPVQVEDNLIKRPDVQLDDIQQEEQIPQPPPLLDNIKPQVSSQPPQLNRDLEPILSQTHQIVDIEYPKIQQIQSELVQLKDECFQTENVITKMKDKSSSIKDEIVKNLEESKKIQEEMMHVREKSQQLKDDIQLIKDESISIRNEIARVNDESVRMISEQHDIVSAHNQSNQIASDVPKDRKSFVSESALPLAQNTVVFVPYVCPQPPNSTKTSGFSERRVSGAPVLEVTNLNANQIEIVPAPAEEELKKSEPKQIEEPSSTPIEPKQIQSSRERKTEPIIPVLEQLQQTQKLQQIEPIIDRQAEAAMNPEKEQGSDEASKQTANFTFRHRNDQESLFQSPKPKPQEELNDDFALAASIGSNAVLAPEQSTITEDDNAAGQLISSIQAFIDLQNADGDEAVEDKQEALLKIEEYKLALRNQYLNLGDSTPRQHSSRQNTHDQNNLDSVMEDESNQSMQVESQVQSPHPNPAADYHRLPSSSSHNFTPNLPAPLFPYNQNSVFPVLLQHPLPLSMLQPIPFQYQYQPSLLQMPILDQQQIEEIIEINKTSAFLEKIILEKNGEQIQHILIPKSEGSLKSSKRSIKIQQNSFIIKSSGSKKKLETVKGSRRSLNDDFEEKVLKSTQSKQSNNKVKSKKARFEIESAKSKKIENQSAKINQQEKSKSDDDSDGAFFRQYTRQYTLKQERLARHDSGRDSKQSCKISGFDDVVDSFLENQSMSNSVRVSNKPSAGNPEVFQIRQLPSKPQVKKLNMHNTQTQLSEERQEIDSEKFWLREFPSYRGQQAIDHIHQKPNPDSAKFMNRRSSSRRSSACAVKQNAELQYLKTLNELNQMQVPSSFSQKSKFITTEQSGSFWKPVHLASGASGSLKQSFASSVKTLNSHKSYQALTVNSYQTDPCLLPPVPKPRTSKNSSEYGEENSQISRKPSTKFTTMLAQRKQHWRDRVQQGDSCQNVK